MLLAIPVTVGEAVGQAVCLYIASAGCERPATAATGVSPAPRRTGRSPAPGLAGWFWWRPVAGQLVQPAGRRRPGRGFRFSLTTRDPCLCGPSEAIACARRRAVITAHAEPSARSRVGHWLDSGSPPPGASPRAASGLGLAIDDHVVFTLQGAANSGGSASVSSAPFVLIAWVQQLEIEFLVRAPGEAAQDRRSPRSGSSNQHSVVSANPGSPQTSAPQQGVVRPGHPPARPAC